MKAIEIAKKPIVIYFAGSIVLVISNHVDNKVLSIGLQIIGALLTILAIVRYFKR